MLEMMRTGGVLMWIIAALSVAAFAVAAERLLFFRRASTDPGPLEDAFRAHLEQGDVQGMRNLVYSSDSSLHRLFQAAVEHWAAEREDMRLVVEQQIRRELFRWEKNMSLLEVIGRTTPLLGLLGTVLGMVEMFASLRTGGQITAAAVTGGIWKALFTTVAGLSVAIPVLFVSSLLFRRIDSEEECLNRGADFLLRERFLSPGRKRENPSS